ncbi:MAG: YjbH domain-containing protein [Rhodobacterales bacterium]
MAAGVAIAPAKAGAQDLPYLSYYGTPGLVDMPSATPLADGTLAFAVAQSGPTLLNTLTFQITPRLSGSFRYAVIDKFDAPDNRYDRSFDISYLLMHETDWRPAVTFGMRDFGGTGLYGSEYIVATKSFGPQIKATAGLGWGRLSGRGGFDNPLGKIDSYFKTRPPAAAGGIATTGQLDTDNWLRGDIAPFGGIEWMPTPRSRFVLEYSSDTAPAESRRGLVDQKSPWNVGMTYRVRPGFDLGLSYRYGSDLGVFASYQMLPMQPAFSSGLEKAPPNILPRETVAARSWNRNNNSQAQNRSIANTAPDGTDADQALSLEQAVTQALAAVDLDLIDMQVTGGTLRLWLVNETYRSEAQAVGRAARVLANTAPPHIEVFEITPTRRGMDLSVIRLNRRDLEDLEQSLEANWQIQARSQIMESPLTPRPEATRPEFTYRLGPYFSPALFDPDNPVRADFGVQLGASYAVTPGLILSGLIRQPLLGNRDSATRPSNSVLPRVRSDAARYDVESTVEMSYLTAEYFYRPAPQIYGRFSAGYLEPMFAGLSSELLWKPVNRNFALGIEANYAVQRDFDQRFGLQDYDVWTGHASAYLDLGGGYRGQIDAGRYLAGDWGATFSLDRTFANGVSIGGFFTLTDVSFDDFGEGSFDKGIRIHIPLSWVSGQATQTGFGTLIRPVNRDGGARLNVRNRLHPLVEAGHAQSLRQSWGRFWR